VLPMDPISPSDTMCHGPAWGKGGLGCGDQWLGLASVARAQGGGCTRERES
jgi:hypothetical protein